jgi:hypothetical protein
LKKGESPSEHKQIDANRLLDQIGITDPFAAKEKVRDEDKEEGLPSNQKHDMPTGGLTDINEEDEQSNSSANPEDH